MGRNHFVMSVVRNSTETKTGHEKVKVLNAVVLLVYALESKKNVIRPSSAVKKYNNNNKKKKTFTIPPCRQTTRGKSKYDL